MADPDASTTQEPGAPTVPREPRTGLRAAFGVVLAVAGLVWLGLGLGMTFFSDEWAFIQSRSLADPVDWFRPHNEHWSTLPIVAYRLMVETLGIGSYVPFQALVIVLHLAVAAIVFRLVERRSGSAWAFVAGTLVAFLGAGFENVFWGFQTGFIGSMALGLAAIDVSDRAPSMRRGWIVVALLVLSLMSSGTGIAMCVVVGCYWLLDRGWRRYLGLLAIPAGAYMAWLFAFGRSGVNTMRNPFTAEALADAPSFVIQGLGDATAAATGLGSLAGILGGVAVIAWASLRLARRTLPPLAGGALTAIVVQYGLIGLVRGGVIEGQVHYSRYAYVTGILMVLALSSLAGRPVRPATTPRRAVVAAVSVSLVGLAFFYNGILLLEGRSLFLERADMTRALAIAGLRRPLPAGTDPARTLVLVPSPVELGRILATYGDPRTDSVVPFAVRPIPTAVQAEADRRVREGAEVPLPEQR